MCNGEKEKKEYIPQLQSLEVETGFSTQLILSDQAGISCKVTVTSQTRIRTFWPWQTILQQINLKMSKKEIQSKDEVNLYLYKSIMVCTVDNVDYQIGC